MRNLTASHIFAFIGLSLLLTCPPSARAESALSPEPKTETHEVATPRKPRVVNEIQMEAAIKERMKDMHEQQSGVQEAQTPKRISGHIDVEISPWEKLQQSIDDNDL